MVLVLGFRVNGFMFCFVQFVLCAVLVAAVAAAPAGSDADATVVRSEVDNIGVEGFKYR